MDYTLWLHAVTFNSVFPFVRRSGIAADDSGFLFCKWRNRNKDVQSKFFPHDAKQGNLTHYDTSPGFKLTSKMTLVQTCVLE